MSIVNMKLRDEFDGDLDRLCARFDISKSALTEKLASAGFEYLEEVKQFR
jgi:hypothetical protein